MDHRPLRRMVKEFLHDSTGAISERAQEEGAVADRVFDELAALRADVDRALADAAEARREARSLGDKLDFVTLCLDEILSNGRESHH